MPNRLEWKPSPEHERRILVIVANKSSARSTGGFRLVLVPFREQARQPVTCALERPGLDSGTKLTKPDSAQGSLVMVCAIPCHSGKPLYRETMPCSIHGYPATSQAEDSASAERRVDRPLPRPGDDQINTSQVDNAETNGRQNSSTPEYLSLLFASRG